MGKLSITFMAGALIALASCSEGDRATTSVSPEPSPSASASGPAIDPCSLLTKEEVAAVQGESFSESKSNVKTEGDLAVGHCFFTLPTFDNSISLQLVQKKAGAEARGPKEDWAEMFHKQHATAMIEGVKKDEPPRRVADVGDEAFWTGNQNIGALYVLKGGRYIRISVGGAGDVEAKIEKSRKLAQGVLGRL